MLASNAVIKSTARLRMISQLPHSFACCPPMIITQSREPGGPPPRRRAWQVRPSTVVFGRVMS
jgi:hypothetical protein